MQPPRLTELDFKKPIRFRDPPRGPAWLRRKPVVVALGVMAAGLLVLAMTPGASDDVVQRDTPDPERVAIPVGESAPDPAGDSEPGSGEPAPAQVTLASAMIPALFGGRRSSDDSPSPRDALEASTGADGWQGGALWMEPFLPFHQSGSVAAVVGAMAAAMPASDDDYDRVEVRSGDSLAAIFSRIDLTPGELHRVVNADEQAQALTRIYPGDELLFRTREEGGLESLRYQLDDTRTLIIDRDESVDAGFSVSIHEEVLETRQLHATGTIDRSLYLAGRQAGLSNRHIMELMSIFEWQVDFNRDIRGGDAFTVVYEADYLDGERVRDGRILAATFVNRGRAYEAVHYEDPNGNRGYYNPDGENMRKAFIRRPVQNARISSGFDRNRKHPVLGVRRPHLGTDFAAPTGTPIMASGNGRVVHAARRGGYGHTIVIQHTNSIRTLYAHLSRYADGIREGTRVEQGQVIGYVGATGLATGPHLHYEFKDNGSHRDPMRVELPNGDPVPNEHRADFQASTSSLLARLQEVTETKLAMRED